MAHSSRKDSHIYLPLHSSTAASSLPHFRTCIHTHTPTQHNTTQHTPQHSSLYISRPLYRTCTQQIQLNLQPPSPASGIEPGPPAWESSTLTSEPRDVRKNTSMFSIYIVNIRVHCMLHFHLTSFIIKM